MKFYKILVAILFVSAVGAAVAAPPSTGVQTVKIKSGSGHKPAPAAKHKHKISAKQAQAIALKKCPGKVVGKVKLEKEDGKWQYAVVIRTRKGPREVMVGAYSGKVESVEKISAAEEKAEAAKAKGGPKAKGPAKTK